MSGGTPSGSGDGTRVEVVAAARGIYETGSSIITGISRAVLASYSAKNGKSSFCLVQIRSRSSPAVTRACRDRFLADFQGDLRVGYQVVIPVRMGRRTAFGTEYGIPVPNRLIGKWADSALCGLGSGVMQKQEWHSLQPSPRPAPFGTELFDDLLIPVIPMVHSVVAPLG